MARRVGTGHRAVTAADAPIIIDHYHAIRLSPGGLDRAGLDAGRLFTLLALYRQIPAPWLRHLLGLEMVIGLMQIVAPLGQTQHLNVLKGAVSRAVVFLDARLHTASGAHALGKIEGIAEHNARNRRRIVAGDIYAILPLGPLLDPLQGCLNLLGRHAPVVILKQGRQGIRKHLFIGGCQGAAAYGQGGGRCQSFQGGSAFGIRRGRGMAGRGLGIFWHGFVAVASTRHY